MADKSQERDPAHGIFGLNVPEPRRTAPAEAPPAYTPGPGQPIYVQAPPAASLWGFSGVQILFLLVVALVVLTAVNLYLVITARQQTAEALSKQADQLNLLTRRMDSSDERYAQLSGKFQVTTERLGLTQQELSRARSLASEVQQQQQASVQQLNEAIAKKASAEEMNKLQSEANTKFGALSGDISGTRKDLEATKEAPLAAKGELTGAIARTHDELIALARKGDRDYFEFSLPRKRARQKVGTVVIELEKTDVKKSVFTVSLYFDDKRTARKDKAVNEPVYFYVQGASSALELVVNKIGKDTIGGYLSTPKGFFSATPNVISARPGT